MDTRLFARIGAGAFVAAALTMSMLQLREERTGPQPEVTTLREQDGGPLRRQLRACAAMGELAVSSRGCRAVWAENRRRFLGLDADTAPSDPDPAASAAPVPPSQTQPAKVL